MICSWCWVAVFELLEERAGGAIGIAEAAAEFGTIFPSGNEIFWVLWVGNFGFEYEGMIASHLSEA